MLKRYLQQTPHITIAIIGFACALMVPEIQRIPAIGYVSFSIFAPLPYFIEVLALLIFVAFYLKFPQKRISEVLSVRIVLALLTAIFAAVIVCQVNQASDIQSLVVQSLYRTTSAFFLILWGERMLPLGAKKLVLTFAGACTLSGIILLALSFAEVNVARIVVLFLPVVAGICFVVYKPVFEGISNLKPRATDFFEEELPFLPHETSKAILLSFGLLFLPLLCRAPVVSVHYSWITVQNTVGNPLFMQISISAGIVCAGLISYFVVRYVWNKNYILVYEFFVLPITFLAFYVSQVSADLWFIYLFIIDVTYKTTLSFLFLSPFMFPKTRNPLIPLLLSFAFMIFSRSCFSALYLLMPHSTFTVITILVICATFAGGGILSFLMLQRSSAEKYTGKAAVDAFAPSEEACSFLAEERELTSREAEILSLLAQKYNAPYIAKKLVVSQSTIKTHMRNIYAKLEIHSQTELHLLIEKTIEELADAQKSFTFKEPDSPT